MYDSQPLQALTDRVAAASDATRAAAARYVALRRECERTIRVSLSLVAASRECRERLRMAVSSYVRVLRVEGTPPERVIVLVKDAVDASFLTPDTNREVMEDVIRWAVDEYYAA